MLVDARPPRAVLRAIYLRRGVQDLGDAAQADIRPGRPTHPHAHRLEHRECERSRHARDAHHGKSTHLPAPISLGERGGSWVAAGGTGRAGRARGRAWVQWAERVHGSILAAIPRRALNPRASSSRTRTRRSSSISSRRTKASRTSTSSRICGSRSASRRGKSSIRPWFTRTPEDVDQERSTSLGTYAGGLVADALTDALNLPNKMKSICVAGSPRKSRTRKQEAGRVTGYISNSARW